MSIIFDLLQNICKLNKKYEVIYFIEKEMINILVIFIKL